MRYTTTKHGPIRLNLTRLAEDAGMSRGALTARLDKGMSLEEALSVPVEIQRRHAKSTRGDPAYNTWVHMKGRCYNPKNSRYYLYGARGIRVCEEWVNDYDAFMADMGPRPNGRYSIERLDPRWSLYQGELLLDPRCRTGYTLQVMPRLVFSVQGC